ncbi:hypothetical protein D9V37_01255 [Nocardioides mangrovicus]|uniref:Glycerophosphoryl diester phosphodiesterase membrane domain-containing protein n=1 Tax=Nocardioides mangrovicus TaxID=2478913 RepID=A0A3L8P6N8_9ACTN|nr:hypothetical protein D9V37_01255 [Nocardioides mangrovicus]
MPLRPLTLGDFFDGAFGTVRRNPRATIGLAALVLAVAMVIPIVFSVVASTLFDPDRLLDGTGTSSSATDAIGLDVGLVGASLVAGLFTAAANIVIAGLVVPVVTRASLGEYISPGDAWRRARGSLLRLVGLSLLEGLVVALVFAVLVGLPVVVIFTAGGSGTGLGVGIALLFLGAVLAAVAALSIHVRWFQLAAPALVSERIGVLAAVRRASRLSRGQFWRILGLFLLLLLVTGVVQQVISLPFTIVGALFLAAFPDHGGFLGLLVSSNLANIVSGAIVTPFVGSVAVLQYLDQRFRKEGFDIELIEHVQRRDR